MAKPPGEREPPPSRATIDRLAAAVYPPLAMLAGMELDVFSAMADAPRSTEEIAGTLKVAPRRLQPLLYALVAGGLLTENQGRFANTPEADHYLVQGRTDYLGEIHTLYRTLWEAALQSAASIREDRPMADHDFSTMDTAEMRRLFAARDAGARGAGRALAERFDFSRFTRLADVGGGGGSLALGACEKNPDLRAALVELPNVAEAARGYLAEIGETARLEVVTADVTGEVPPGRYDVAILRSVLQVLSPEQAQTALVNVGRAMEPGGMLLIIGRVLDDSRLSPPETVGFGLVFISLYQDGAAYTEAEHRDWLQAAGFTGIERHVQPDEVGIITARKV